VLSDYSNVAMTFSGTRAVAISKGAIVLLDLDTGQPVRTLGNHSSASRVGLTPDAKTVISLGTGGKQFLRVWDSDTGHMKREFPVAEERLTWAISLALSADGSLALTGSMDGMLKAWDLQRGQEIHQMKSRGEWMCSLALTPDGTRAVTISGGTGTLEDTGILEMWDVARGTLIASFCAEAPLTECAIHDDGSLAVCAEDSGRVHVLRLMGERLASKPA
jgi:WD40 repeat protein